MPRPSDWDAIGLGGDPTPGEPETIGQLAEVLQKLGGKARGIFSAIESVMNTNNDSVFVGQAADALRGKVDGRLRGHVEDVATAFETSAQALRDWRGVVEEQQRRADAALAAGRGLADDDPERDRQKGVAEQAGRDQSDQASTYSGRISGVSDIQLPISGCEAFWEAFKWLAIILIIPALIFGGPIALLAIGVNLALFIKTIVDVANGDASFLDLFLAGLGLIAPTTKALPIFSIISGIAKGIGAGVKGIANAFRTIFSKDFLFKAMTGLKGLPVLATIAIRETGLFVVSNIRNFSVSVGNFASNFGSITLGAIGKGLGTVWSGGKQFISAHFGGLQWTRLVLPVAADEIRAFKALGMTDFQAFTQALKVGVFGRGLAGQHVFGLPMVSALGHTISAIPINTPTLTFMGNVKSFFKDVMQPPKLEPSVHLNGFGLSIESGFNAGKAFEDLHLPPMHGVGGGPIGQTINTPTVVTPSGLHVPAPSGINGVNGVGIHGLVENLPSSGHIGVPGAAVNNVTHNIGIPGTSTSFTHTGGVNVTPTATNVGSLHVSTPTPAGVGDLVGSGLRNNTPTFSTHFATSINEGVSHGFQANHLRLSLDDLTRTPTPSTTGAGHVVNPPTVDRVNAALDLVTGGPADLKIGAPGNLRTDTPSVAGVQNVAAPPTAHVQPVMVPKTDVPVQPQIQPGHSFNTGKTEIPLSGLPDHPGAMVKVERFEGGVTQFNLHGGGPNGRLDPLNGGGLRFTDTSTGVTTRFDSSGVVVDHGVRLTKADGLARIDDRVLIRRPDGEFRITNLDGSAVPDQLTIRPLDTGGVQVLGKDGMSWHYNANGKLETQSVSAAWNSDLAAKAGVFRKPGDTDAAVNATMDDFTNVQQAQHNVDLAHENVAIHGDRIDGPSNAPPVGDQVHLDLQAAQHDLDLAKNAFEGKHELSVDGLQKQLDDLTTDSLNLRPRLLGSGRTMTYDVPGNAGVKFDVSGGQVTVHGPGSEAFTSSLAGKTLTIAHPDTGRTWTYSLGFGGRANQIGESFPLNGGLFDGKPASLEGKLGVLDQGFLHDGAGTHFPVKVTDDGLVVASPNGPLHYTRTGEFHGIGESTAGQLPKATPPPRLDGADVTRWNAQVELSRTHLGEAASNKAVENLMKDVTGGAFTSKRGFGGYVNPTALADGTLVSKVKNFDTVTKDLMFKGPADHITVYRGVSMDPISAQADEFIERLPISTSSTLKFQDDWAKNGVDSNRVVFKVDVPPNQGKLAMSYPEGYHPGGGEARAWNQDQWEITLGPAKFTRTGPDIVENGHRIIPVKAEPIPAGSFDDVITAKWPGISSEAAFGDFVKSFETSNLRGFEGLEDIATRATTSVDGLSHTVHVGKPGSLDELTITVLRDSQTDSVRVIWTADGANQFDKTWRGQDFSNLATDLRGNVLHNNDQFLGMPKPASWDQTHTAPRIQQHPLGGAFDHHVVVRPEGGTTHVTGPNAHQFRVFDLPDGGFRVVGTHGQMQRYGADGAHLGDGTMLNDAFHVRGTFFTEADGTGGWRAVDLNGTPLANTTVEKLPNGQFRVADDAVGDVRWYGQDGIYRGSGIRVADPAYQGEVFLYHGLGRDPVLLDHAGVQLPGTVTTFEGGFRVVEANGIARTFDDAGIYLDRRIPLGGNQTIVHDVNNNLALHNAAGTVQHAPGGYRVVDQGNYHVYDADGVFQAHGHTVNLPGQNGFLEITGNGARRLDLNYQPIPGRNVTFDAATGEITVTRASGHDVFDLQGGVLREITDLDAHGLGVGSTRVTRDQNGVVAWTDRNGAPVPTPHRVTIDQNGAVRLEINVPGGPRNGEFHVFSRDGHLTEQGFPVVRNGEPTEFTYVVNRTDNTWRRVDSHNLDGTGSFQHGKVDVAGLDNGRIRLQSSTAKEVEVFERRWLPDGTILDSFRKTDTLGYSWFDRRTTWATYDANGVLTNWGKRQMDTGGNSWRDYDHRGNAVRDYQQGLQKYANPVAEQLGPLGKAEKEITGHVLAIKDGRQWRWNRYDADGLQIASGDRALETIGEGWTDTVRVMDGDNEVTVIAQQKWGTWHGPDKARQYQEFKLEAGATHPSRSGEFEVQSPQLKSVGKGELLDSGALLKTVRQGDQRPPIWVRENFLDNPPTVASVSHISGDDRFQIFRWETSGDGIDAGRGIRYVGTDESVVDVDLNGAFVRSKGQLHDGTELKVGDHATAPGTAHPNTTTPWTAGDLNGWRVFDNNNGWRDVAEVDGVQGWTVVRESYPGGAVREFPQPADRNIWVQRDPHGNLVGSSHQTPAPVGGNHRYVVATGAADSSHWRWRELDHNGVQIAGREGDRFHFKGSGDENLSWDNSFRDFDAGGNLVRDRHLLDERRFVESWQDGDQWRVAEFDKTGQEVAGTTRLDRQWRAADGTWQQDWTAGSQHFRDSLPQNGQVGPQVVRETPPHVGDGRPIRVREYTLDNGQTDFKQWKEFDFDEVVRERAASGTNYLETDKIHGQWKLYDADGQVIGERSDNGLVFELRDGRLTLTGNEFDFRGALTEYRGWNTRIGDTQRQPWLMQSDLTMADITLTPGGTAFREANYAPFSRLLTQKVLLQVGTEFFLDYAASLMIAGIVADAQNKPFTGNDALKALMNAAVGATLKSVAGAALTETKLGGSLRNLKQSLGNVDGGKFITRRPNNNDATWGVEWAGNTSPARWRGGVFDYSLNMMLLPLTGFVNGTMNAAIFGVPNADGTTVKLSGWQAVGEGGIAVLSGYAIGNSLGLLKLVGGNFSAGRFFQKAGFADIVLTMPLRLFEKGIGGAFLTPAIRASINPSWYQVPLVLPPVEGAP